jgi:hypothetical protein
VELEDLILQQAMKGAVNMASVKWYWFSFADGYQVCCRGMDRIEKAAEERKHGKLISKKLA